MTDKQRNPSETLWSNDLSDWIDREAIQELMATRWWEILKDILLNWQKKVDNEVFHNWLYHNQQLSRVQVLVNERNCIDLLMNLPSMICEDESKEISFINKQIELETEREIKRLSE